MSLYCWKAYRKLMLFANPVVAINIIENNSASLRLGYFPSSKSFGKKNSVWVEN